LSTPLDKIISFWAEFLTNPDSSHDYRMPSCTEAQITAFRKALIEDLQWKWDVTVEAVYFPDDHLRNACKAAGIVSEFRFPTFTYTRINGSVATIRKRGETEKPL
jgi:hypothetical protein